MYVNNKDIYLTFIFLMAPFPEIEVEALLKGLYLTCPPGGGRTLGISGWGCAAGTLEPLTHTRASSAEFCYPILE